jgi:drug/metabolite transporter (DMT)-like permease
MLKERLPVINIIGILFSFTGIIIMLVDKEISFSTSIAGAGLLLFAVFSAVIYSIFIKKLALKYNAFTIIAVQNLIGAIYFLPLFLIFGFKGFISIKPNFELISSLFQLALFASTLAFVFFTISVREIGVSRTSVFGNIIPVFTAIFSFLILSEEFDTTKIIGMVIVVFGVFLTQIKKLMR